MKQIKIYEKALGQKVNREKSFFLTNPKAGAHRINRIRDCTGFMDKEFSFTYLGCPIYIGRKKISYFDNMATKVIKRLNGWQGKLLTFGGKAVLIKSVLQSIPTYALSAINSPKTTLKLLEKHFARFYWVLMETKANIIGVLEKSPFSQK